MKPAELTTTNTTTTEIAARRHHDALWLAMAAAADQAADLAVFDDYTSRKAANTTKAQLHDLEAFAAFLQTAAASADAGAVLVSGATLQTDPAAWQPITHGLIVMFRRQMEADGYTISTINRRLATVRAYAKPAAPAPLTQTEPTGSDLWQDTAPTRRRASTSAASKLATPAQRRPAPDS